MLTNSLDKLSKKHYDLERQLLEIFIHKYDNDKLEEVLKNLQNLHKIPGKIKINKKEDLFYLSNRLQKFIGDIVQQKVPVIDLKKLIDICNELSDYLSQDKQEYSIDHLEEQIAIISFKDEEIPISFSNGKKTVITSNNFDLSQFSREELIELLRLLDVIVKDNKYDYLRTEIMEQLNSISNVTFL